MIEHLQPLDILAMSDVKRWHSVATRRPQNLAEHSYRVAIIAVWLGHHLNHEPENPFTPEVELQVWRLAAVHDIPETQWGDVPTPTKRALGIDYDEIMDARFWVERGSKVVSPWRAAGLLARRLVLVADVLDGLAYWAAEGVTTRRAMDHLTVIERLVSETWAAVDREFPSLEPAVSVFLNQAGLPDAQAYRFDPEKA